jgi:GNAT superfamily N-acetyltransferase
MIFYRKMVPADIQACMELSKAAGWNQLEIDWQAFMRLGPEDNVVAISGDDVIGSVATIRYGEDLSWIGMLLVHPDFRGKGVGKDLLLEAVQKLAHEKNVKLDATSAGRQIYLQCGFEDEYPISRMEARSVSVDKPGPGCFPAEEKDLAGMFEIDGTVFGAGRQMLLKQVWFNGLTFSFVSKSEGKILGYSLGRRGYRFFHIGPIIADNIEVAKSLLQTVLHHTPPETPVILDVNHADKEWLSWLHQLGFTEQRNFMRMFRGNNTNPGIPEKQFAILGPEFG